MLRYRPSSSAQLCILQRRPAWPGWAGPCLRPWKRHGSGSHLISKAVLHDYYLIKSLNYQKGVFEFNFTRQHISKPSTTRFFFLQVRQMIDDITDRPIWVDLKGKDEISSLLGFGVLRMTILGRSNNIGVSWVMGAPLVIIHLRFGFFIINHPFWHLLISGNPHMANPTKTANFGIVTCPKWSKISYADIELYLFMLGTDPRWYNHGWYMRIIYIYMYLIGFSTLCSLCFGILSHIYIYVYITC